MAVLGFDPSLTHFGWVLLDEHGKGKDRLLDFGTFATTRSDGLLVQRLILQRERARQLIKSTGVNFVSMEAPYWQDFSTELLFALNQFLHSVFLDLEVFVLYLQPMSLKKAAVPDMNPHDATKHHITHAAKTELDKHGRRFSEHVSDAYFAGKVGCKFYKWFILRELNDSDLTKDEWNLFCGKHTFKRGVKKGITEYKGIIYKENDQFFDYRKNYKRSKQIIKDVQNG